MQTKRRWILQKFESKYMTLPNCHFFQQTGDDELEEDLKVSQHFIRIMMAAIFLWKKRDLLWALLKRKLSWKYFISMNYIIRKLIILEIVWGSTIDEFLDSQQGSQRNVLTIHSVKKVIVVLGAGWHNLKMVLILETFLSFCPMRFFVENWYTKNQGHQKKRSLFRSWRVLPCPSHTSKWAPLWDSYIGLSLKIYFWSRF